MSKQHDVIVNRMLANYVERLLELDDDGDVYHADFFSVCGLLKLQDDDIELIKKSMRKKIKQLEKSSWPLGPKVMHWRDELMAAAG